jgi:ribosomal protein S18 acetylase RimI-like enzyme
MKFLLDTNEFIAAEPADLSGVEPGSATMATLLQLISEGGHTCFLHPAALDDIGRDKDASRREVRKLLFKKYAKLPATPPIPDEWEDELSESVRDNDRVDLLHLAAVKAFAVNYLVTEDRGIHRRARKLGISNRVVTAADALALLRGLFEVQLRPPPAVDSIYAYELSPDDPFFESLRSDYPDFDGWFEKVRLQHRIGWAIYEDDSLAALCLIKDETDENDLGFAGKLVKISTLKVAPQHTGRKYGELLLKAIFAYASRNSTDVLYVTVFDDAHPALISLLEGFGFRYHASRTLLGEAILHKRLTPHRDDLEPLEHHVTYGPPALKIAPDQVFVVPIRPTFAERLFPDAGAQTTLAFAPTPYGNALRKAYLCRASTQRIQPGATLLFYRSTDEKSVIAVGVVDDLLRSKDPMEIASAVGTRTVYTLREIEEMCAQGRNVLAILFRQDRILVNQLSLHELRAERLLRGHPQSITQATVGDATWLHDRLAA